MASPRTWRSASTSCRPRGRGLWRSWSPSLLPTIPEPLGGAVSMRDQGRTRGFAIGVWTVTAAILAAAVVGGNAVLSGASEKSLSVLLSFAGGAVLASLADTLMPAAYRVGGKSVAFATATGFFVSFVISEL